MSVIPVKLGAEFYRGTLNSLEQSCYDKINAQIMRGDYSGKISYNASSKSASEAWFNAYKAIRLDRPDYFFLGTASKYNSVGSDGTFTYDILYSNYDIQKVQARLKKWLDEITRLTSRMGVIEREEAIYEKIAKSLTYVNNGKYYDHNIAGPLLYSTGVCEGHNALLMLSLRAVGIPCIKVDGWGKNESHAWSIVWLGSETFHCDVTWDNAENGIVSFDYLNLSDRQISTNHSKFKEHYLPVCKNEQYYYHRYHGLCASSPSELGIMLKRTDFSRGPLRVHLDYRIFGGVYKEISKAFDAAAVYGRHTVYSNDDLNNALVIGS